MRHKRYSIPYEKDFFPYFLAATSCHHHLRLPPHLRIRLRSRIPQRPTIVKIVVIAVPIILCVAYLTYWERKMIGWMHVRLGPTRVGFRGLLQPFADVFKLLTKEVVVPSQANKLLFVVAPLVILMPAFWRP